MNLRTPQSVVSINVAHTAQNALIQQESLNSCATGAHARRKLLSADLQRVCSESQQLRSERSLCQIRHSPKASRVRVTQLAAVVQLHANVGMLFAGLRARTGSKLPGHSEVHQE